MNYNMTVMSGHFIDCQREANFTHIPFVRPCVYVLFLITLYGETKMIVECNKLQQMNTKKMHVLKLKPTTVIATMSSYYLMFQECICQYPH